MATPIILQVSQAFCCPSCSAPVALTIQQGGDLTYECQNVRCQRVVSADCPEALQVRETLELPTPRQLGARIATYRRLQAVTI
jgi:hypothetical protein